MMLVFVAVLLLFGIQASAVSEWGYTNDSSTECGIELPCGPDKWAEVSESCAAEHEQSPIFLDPSAQEHSHHLDELRWKVSECLEATSYITSSGWRVELGPDCERSFELDRFGNYFAHAFEFHAPSEHTFDEKHLEMEVQIEHTSEDGKHHLTVAVLLEANANYSANSFLGPIWDSFASLVNYDEDTNSSHAVSPSSITTAYPSGALNFVDNLLPSHGLSFDYIMYEGSSTKPNCSSVLWIVMKHSATLSLAQVSAFLSTMQSVPETRTRSDGSNNRPLQALHGRILELYEDADCYIRYCHNIFMLGTSLSLVKAGGFLGVLICFTLLFEAISDFIERKVAHRRTAREMVAKVYKELSVLGLVSFVTFTFNSICGSGYSAAEFVEFEFVHILIFVVAILYVFFSGLLLYITMSSSLQWDKVLRMEGEEVLTFLHAHYHKYRPAAWSFLGSPGPTLDLGMFHCHELFIERYHLPDNFDFLKYVKYYLSLNIKNQLDISPTVWIVVPFVLALWGAWSYFAGITFVYGPIGWFNLFVVFVVWALCLVSFKRMLKLLGVASMDSLKEKVKNRGVKPLIPLTKSISMAVDPSAAVAPPPHTEKTGNSSLNRSNSTAQIQASMMRLAKQENELKKLRACWVPGGSPVPIRVTTNVTMLCIAFYFGFYLLNARTYLSGFQQFLVISSVALVMGLFLPMVVLTITAIEAMIEPDFNLIGEVIEYTDELHRVRELLVNTLFPDFDTHLMDDVTEAEIDEVFHHFDKNGDFTIDIIEFARGCQMMGMRMSEPKARRFVRFFDNDRSGDIDGVELFTAVFNERISRIDTKLVAAFRQQATKSKTSTDIVKFDDISSVAHKVFGESTDTLTQIIEELTEALVALASGTGTTTDKQPKRKKSHHKNSKDKEKDKDKSKDKHRDSNSEVRTVTLLDYRQELVKCLTKRQLNYGAVIERLRSERLKNASHHGWRHSIITAADISPGIALHKPSAFASSKLLAGRSATATSAVFDSTPPASGKHSGDMSDKTKPVVLYGHHGSTSSSIDIV
eukprot:c6506_g1_i1.p1 GENE.c6506_g1_i1~~c6506_g1_i1.p1  ORF type:complete len:1035 (-),score=228.32 c6506_g1_i1:337-3441(-)